MKATVSPILRIVEVIPEETLMQAFNRRMLKFLDNGVEEYWAVCEELKDIGVNVRRDSRPLPADWQQTVEEFFAEQ